MTDKTIVYRRLQNIIKEQESQRLAQRPRRDYCKLETTVWIIQNMRSWGDKSMTLLIRRLAPDEEFYVPSQRGNILSIDQIKSEDFLTKISAPILQLGYLSTQFMAK